MTAGDRAKALADFIDDEAGLPSWLVRVVEGRITSAVREAESAATARERARCRHLVDGAEPFIGREGVSLLLHEIDHPEGG